MRKGVETGWRHDVDSKKIADKPVPCHDTIFRHGAQPFSGILTVASRYPASTACCGQALVQIKGATAGRCCMKDAGLPAGGNFSYAFLQSLVTE
jgi:hypothetical protein